ncbi:MAPEG family protein [Oceaniserpentilla sp. 4NH20-0058]|uniref:MAPEG family protein n=1 Tax=Oceaniserpentilla sp. 4NH20-0058 TaxID=3127660 RepID=UPI003104876E
MIDTQILAPVIALICWSMVMWFWMLAIRLPAISIAKMKMDPHAIRGEQVSQLPSKVRWKADNYNHLMEQPTIFYALAITLGLLGEGSGLNAQLAWAYVALRVVHSLVQALTNIIEIRFVVFVLSNIPLAWLSVNGLTHFLSISP